MKTLYCSFNWSFIGIHNFISRCLQGFGMRNWELLDYEIFLTNTKQMPIVLLPNEETTGNPNLN